MKKKILLIALVGALLSLNAKAQLWSGASGNANGWKYVSWFGWFWSENEDAGWLYQENLGWMYASGQNQNDIFFWTSDLEWIFSGNGTYPAFYSDSLKKWALYNNAYNTSDSETNSTSVYPLQWWDFDAELYVSRDSLAFQTQPTNPLGSEYTLEKSIMLIRHGQRYPEGNLPNTNVKQWPSDDLGILTEVGKMEEQYLGGIFKDKLSQLSLTTSNVYITADSRTSRTVESAEYFSVGLGLYSDPSSVPVIKGDSTDKFFEEPQDNDTAHAINDNTRSTSAWTTLISNFDSAANNWETESGYSTLVVNNARTGQTNVSVLADNLQYSWITTNPPSTPSPFSITDLAQTWGFANSANNMIFSQPYIGWWRAQYLLEGIANALNGKNPTDSSSDSDDVFFLFGGHDGTIWPLVSALGTGLPQNPIYASFVDISVYDKAGDKFVYVSYNGVALDLSSICGNSDPCPLATFQQYLTDGPSTTSQ